MISPEKPERRYVLQANSFAVPRISPGLYLVATPIGNLKDITIRALETLAGADLILCEDTRTSARLLDHYLIHTHREALHEHNETARVPGLIERLKQGATIALISDAGTPLLSDPGFPLVRAAREEGLPVFAIPGASALLGALASAGLPTDSFSFFGFLPVKSGARATRLKELEKRGETLVFYESPRRLATTLAVMTDVFGTQRRAVVALELTKKFERVVSGTLAELGDHFASETKGEAVILVAGAIETGPDEADWQQALADALAEQNLRSAVDDIAARFGIKRKQVYNAALALKSEK